MSTGEKERKVIHRAVRVLDEIETRIHELREELEANGMTSTATRGRKARHDEEHDDDGHESQAQPRGRRAKADHDDAGGELHGAAKDAHEAKAGGANKADHDDEHEPHGQGRVKHPEADKRVKANKD